MAVCAKNKVIMVTGYSGSGKTELSSMLREEFKGEGDQKLNGKDGGRERTAKEHS